jgi:hypothetical protein
MPNDDSKFRLKAALKGFDDARRRLHDVARPMTSSSPEEVFVPLSEALWWTVSIDEGFEDLADGGHGYRPSVSDYQTARNADPSGQVLRAVRYVRNKCGHQRAIAVVVVPFGIGGPIVRPISGGGYLRWRSSSDLPLSDPRHEKAALRAAYDTLLAGRFPGDAVDSASIWFASEQARAGI